MKKYYNLNEGYLSKLDDNNETLISAVDVDNIDKYSKIEKDDKQSFEDFKTQYKGVIDMKCTQDYGNCEDKDLWEDCAKELFLTSKNYLLQGDEYKASDLEKKTENKQLTESNDINVGDEYINDYGAKITILEPTKDGEYQFKVTNTKTGVEGDVLATRSMKHVLDMNGYKKVESKNSSDRYQLRKFPSEQEYKGEWGAYDTKEDKFVQKGSRYVMKAAIIDLNRKDSKTESKINDIIANKGILNEIKTFNDKTIRDSFLNMCELEQISIRNQIQVLQECRRLIGKEPLTESNDDNYTNQDIRKAVKKVLDKDHNIFTDDSIYDVVEVLTGISDIDKMPKELLNRIRNIVEKDRYRKVKKEDKNDREEFNYMLLDRLKQDCEYFLGNGNGNADTLWAKDIDEQIAKMKELYNSFTDDQKPEWITMEDIDNYEKKMKEYNKEKKTEVTERDLSKDLFQDEANRRIYNRLINLDVYLEQLKKAIENNDTDSIIANKSKIKSNVAYLIPALNIKGSVNGLTDYLKTTDFDFENNFKKTADLLKDLNNEDKKEESVISDYTLSEINKVLSSNENEFTLKIVNSNEDVETKTLNIDREDLISIYNVLGGNKDSLQEDQYENERRRGKPSIKKIAENEYYDNQDWYIQHIKDYKDVDDFIKQEIFEIASEYNLKEDTAIQVCKEIYNLAIKNQSKTESFKITDPRDKRRKLIVPDKIENVLKSSKFEEIKSAIKKHDGIISNPRIYVNDNKLGLNYSFTGFNDEEHMKVFSDLGFNDLDTISNGQLNGWGYSQYEAPINIEGITVILSYSPGVRIISIEFDYPLKEDTANNEPFYRYDNQENFEKAKREYQRNPNEETLKAFKDARSAFEKEINAKKE